MISLKRGEKRPEDLDKFNKKFLKDTQGKTKEEKVKELNKGFYYGKWKTDEVVEMFSKINNERCSFCTHRIAYFKKEMTIEHIELKSVRPEKAFEWENLLCSCRRCNTIRSRKPYKKEEYIDPTKERNVEKYFLYSIDGRIHVNTELNAKQQHKAKKMLDMYGMNNKEFIVERRNFIKDIYNKVYYDACQGHDSAIIFMNVWKQYEGDLTDGEKKIQG